MRKNSRRGILCLLILICSVAIGGLQAAATANGGGQVSTKSKITFYKNEEKPIKDRPKDQASKQGLSKLPQTGESLGHYFAMGTVFIIISIVLLIWMRRRWKYEK